MAALREPWSEAMVFDRAGRVVAASPGLAATIGQVRPACVGPDGAETGLTSVLASGRYSGVFTLPGRCDRPSVAAHASGTVVIAQLDAITAPLASIRDRALRAA